MKFLRLAQKNKERFPQSWEVLYGKMIENKIRTKYSINQELSIQRQRDKKPDEFAAYDAFVEQCKAEVKAEMKIES